MNNKVFRIQMINRGLKCLKNGGECEFRWYLYIDDLSNGVTNMNTF